MGLTAVVAALVLAGCQVSTSVAVRVAKSGRGSVTVGVDFDRAAALAVGGVDGALDVSDLVAAGWKVTSGSGPGGSTVVTLVHAFATLSEVPAILAEVGRSPTGRSAPLMSLHVSQTRTLSTTTTTATGRIDLSCALSCFGDAALQRTYGSELGVDPAALRTAAGRAAIERDLPFSFELVVPGHVTASDATAAAGPTAAAGSTLRWTPVLGRRTLLSATASAVDPVRVTEASDAGGVTVVGTVIIGFVVVVVVVLLSALGLRRRRSRRRPQSQWP